MAIVARARTSAPLAYWPDMQAPDLHDEKGFRIRGLQPTRMDAFVDAAFAFAVTLLVVAVGRIPTSVPELALAMRGVPAFAASFMLISRFWQSHRHWSRRYGLEDAKSVRLSLALVFVTLVYVYPLRMVAAVVMAMLSGGMLAEQSFVIDGVAEWRVLYITFAVGYGVVSLIFSLLYGHALDCADALDLSPIERVRTRTSIDRYRGFLGVAVLSLLLAVFLPLIGASPALYSLPGFAYLLIYAVRPWYERRERAALARLPPRVST
jgi:uncharacterized membrane protein